MSSGGSDARAVLRASSGLTLHLALPEGATLLAEGALPAIDVGSLSGASVALRGGFTAASESTAKPLRFVAACVRAPSDRWAEGLASLVLDRATSLGQRALAAPVSTWSASPIEQSGDRFEQRLTGEGDERGVMRHLLAFEGEAHSALLCTMACAEPSAEGRCASLIDRATIEADFTSAPPPSLLVQGVFWAAEHPSEAGVLTLALALATVGSVLWQRPRPRP